MELDSRRLDMWLQYYQPFLTDLVQTTLVNLCSEHLPTDDHIELDGLVCISSGNHISKQIVVKIHKIIEPVAQKPGNGPAPMKTKDGAVLTSMTIAKDVQFCKVEELATVNRKSPSVVSNKEQHENDDIQSDAQAICLTVERSKPKESIASSENLGLSDDFEGTLDSNASVSATSEEGISGPKLSKASEGIQGQEIKCTECPDTFSTQSDYGKHLKAFHNRHICSLCQKTFTLSSNLRRHMKLHTGIRPHVCKVCGVSFSRNTDLNIHMRKHQDNGKATFQLTCGQCSRTFNNMTMLEEHRNKMHGVNEETFYCDFCEKAFGSSEQLEEHLTVHSNSLSKQNSMIEDNGHNSDDQDCPLPEAKKIRLDGSKYLENGRKVINHQEEASSLNADTDDNSSRSNNIQSNSLMEMVKEFAPLFSMNDEDADMNSSQVVPLNLNSKSTYSRMTSLLGPDKLRNKRKGLPVKQISILKQPFETSQNNALPETVVEANSLDIPINIKTEPANSDFNSSADDSKLSIKSVEYNDDSAEVQLYTCRHGGCNTTWYGFDAYESHYVSAHWRYPCSSCDQSFTSRNNRRRHANSHGNARKHDCDVCEKQFTRPDIVKEHRITHTLSYQGNRCRNCGLTSEKKTILLTHLKKCLKQDDIDSDIVRVDKKMTEKVPVPVSVAILT